MTSNPKAVSNVVVTTASIIDKITEARDSYITEFLTAIQRGKKLQSLSKIRVEFLKRDLIEIKCASLDLVHYASLIKHLKEVNSQDVDRQHLLIRDEIFSVVRKYGVEYDNSLD